jgi:hypothetical protein
VNKEVIINVDLVNYLIENIKVMSECDIEEKNKCFPYTRATNEFFQILKEEYGIQFSKDLISEKLLEKMINEIIINLPN